jgi:hypothetical protein
MKGTISKELREILNDPGARKQLQEGKREITVNGKTYKIKKI